MVVLIPNPNQMLELIKFQKTFIKMHNTKEICFYQATPLWIPLNTEENFDFSKDDLTKTAKSITSVQICPPELKLLPEQDTVSLVSQVFINQNQSDLKSQLILCKSLTNTKIIQKKISSQEIFPMSLKVFRIGNKIQISENSSALSDFVWKKLR